MAGRTGAGDLRMIDFGCRFECDGGVAVVAKVAAADVADRFAGSGDPIVATHACARDLAVVNRIYQYPATGGVAACAAIGGLGVVSWFASRCRAVVAAGAGANHLVVVYLGGGYP